MDTAHSTRFTERWADPQRRVGAVQLDNTVSVNVSGGLQKFHKGHRQICSTAITAFRPLSLQFLCLFLGLHFLNKYYVLINRIHALDILCQIVFT